MRMEGKQGLDHKCLPAMAKMWSLFEEEWEVPKVKLIRVLGRVRVGRDIWRSVFCNGYSGCCVENGLWVGKKPQ